MHLKFHFIFKSSVYPILQFIQSFHPPIRSASIYVMILAMLDSEIASTPQCYTFDPKGSLACSLPHYIKLLTIIVLNSEKLT